MSPTEQDPVTYDEWPFGESLELRVKPRWSSAFVVRYLIAGVFFGAAIGLVLLGFAAIVVAITGGSLTPYGWLLAIIGLVAGVQVPLVSEMAYREDKARERFKVVPKA